MDQAQINSLDPKLRETYERIMGTAVESASPQTPPVVPPPAVDLPPPAAAQPPQASVPIQPNPIAQIPLIPPAQPAPEMPAGNAPGMINQPAADTQTSAYIASEVAGAKQSIKMIQVMYIVGGIFFFLAYAFFWMKFFNVATPF